MRYLGGTETRGLKTGKIVYEVLFLSAILLSTTTYTMKVTLVVILAIALVVCVAAAETKKCDWSDPFDVFGSPIFKNFRKKKESYYDILGVETTASEKDLKKAYFKLIVKYHPDKIADFDTNANAQQKFQEISHAIMLDFWQCLEANSW